MRWRDTEKWKNDEREDSVCTLHEVNYVSQDATRGISCKHLAGMFLSSLLVPLRRGLFPAHRRLSPIRIDLSVWSYPFPRGRIRFIGSTLGGQDQTAPGTGDRGEHRRCGCVSGRSYSR